MRRVAMAAALWAGLCAPAAAQIAAPDPPGPYVIDVRGATISLPQDAAFFPSMPASTAVPSRGYGIEVGVHVYLLQLGAARFGVGAMLARVRGTASPSSPDDEEDSTSVAGLATTPEVAALLTTAGPQISVNFGTRAGWSYLSAGVGRGSIATRTSAFADEDSEGGIAQSRLVENGGLSSVNVGGGARWFAKSRLAFSFDVRFHMLRGGGDTETPAHTLVATAVGLSIR